MMEDATEELYFRNRSCTEISFTVTTQRQTNNSSLPICDTILLF